MRVLEKIYYDSKLYRMVFIDRNGNEFTLSYISVSGNIEIMVDNDSVVVEDVIEAYNEFEKKFWK